MFSRIGLLDLFHVQSESESWESSILVEPTYRKQARTIMTSSIRSACDKGNPLAIRAMLSEASETISVTNYVDETRGISNYIRHSDC